MPYSLPQRFALPPTGVKERLEGEIDRLQTFELGKLRGNKTFGCPGRKDDSDDTELMRAIYCLVFSDAWKNISMENLGDGKLRGDTLNSFNTLLSPIWKDDFFTRWNPDEELKMKRQHYLTTCYTMGNMVVLPDRRIGDWSINKHRGCHDEWHDYEDRFLAAPYLVLTKQPGYDEDLEELVRINDEDFKPYYGMEGWKHFVDLNMLEYYVDDNYKPIVKSKGYTYWRGGYTNRDRFFAECHRYIDDSTRIINLRAKRMLEKIKVQLNLE